MELGDEATSALLELTSSPNADHRWWALRVLAQSPHAQAELLVPFLNDSAREVRQCAALGLALKPGENAVESLVRLGTFLEHCRIANVTGVAQTQTP